MLRSADGGANWQKVPSGSEVSFQAGTLVLANEIGQLFVSRDACHPTSPSRLKPLLQSSPRRLPG